MSACCIPSSITSLMLIKQERRRKPICNTSQKGPLISGLSSMYMNHFNFIAELNILLVWHALCVEFSFSWYVMLSMYLYICRFVWFVSECVICKFCACIYTVCVYSALSPLLTGRKELQKSPYFFLKVMEEKKIFLVRYDFSLKMLSFRTHNISLPAF